MVDNSTRDLIIVITIALSLSINKAVFDEIREVLKFLVIGLIILGLLVLGVVYFVKKSLTKRKSESLEATKPIVLSQIEEHTLTEKRLPLIEDSRKTEKTPQIAAIPKRKDITITLDADKRFFRFRELKLEEVNYLLAKGYRISEHKSLSSNKKEKYLLKTRFNESLNHCFVVFDIANFLESKGVQVSLFVTKKPDLVFELNSRKFAVEVETGKVIKKKRPELIKKVNLLKKEYDEWFFVVSDKKLVQKYRSLGKTIEKRYLLNYLEKILKWGQISPQKSSNQNNSYRRMGAFSKSKKPPTIIGS